MIPFKYQEFYTHATFPYRHGIKNLRVFGTAMPSKTETVASFVEAAPPGEVSRPPLLSCRDAPDIKSLTYDDSQILQSLQPAFKKYNEEQFTTVKLPGSTETVIVSSFNELGDGRYFDSANQSSFEFDHTTQKASSVQPHTLDSQHAELIISLLESLSTHAAEHFPASSIGVYPTENDSAIALVIVANKYSPNNFWNGRWRSVYIFTPSSSTVAGSIKVDVHYYEDGNVRLLTEKPVQISGVDDRAQEIVKQIARVEKKYQEDLNKAFSNLSEGAFKGLRRQLPVTRQKVEWEKIGGYRLGQDIGGGRSR
ncbi:F-actin-capping protein subunit alpha [Zalaria obscura]|uniref:F-actin-capping protein subunit alpha n=1 Tax=Zalaria obscura TaxID=2024903 RepID=A0ACC3SKS6_9PEZI